MPKVWNKRDKNIPANAVYCGRPSIWGNPFVIGPDGNREDVIRKHKEWFINQPEFLSGRAIKELGGKDLICFCAPLPCHCDTLIELVNK